MKNLAPIEHNLTLKILAIVNLVLHFGLILFNLFGVNYIKNWEFYVILYFAYLSAPFIFLSIRILFSKTLKINFIYLFIFSWFILPSFFLTGIFEGAGYIILLLIIALAIYGFYKNRTVLSRLVFLNIFGIVIAALIALVTLVEVEFL